MILPSILILIGELDVKKRSEAFFSTISRNSGFVLSTKLRVVSVPTPSDESPTTRSWGGAVPSVSIVDAMAGLLLFLEDLQRARLVAGIGVLALALELDPQP